jgi:hypothetical protein
MAVFE